MDLALDTNVILDFALKRQPFFEDAVKLFSLTESEGYRRLITTNTVTDIYYVVRKEKGRDIALEFIKDLLAIVTLVGIDEVVIHEALTLGWKDFEDAIQYTAVNKTQVDVIITRNKKDFVEGAIAVQTPAEFIQSIQ